MSENSVDCMLVFYLSLLITLLGENTSNGVIVEELYVKYSLIPILLRVSGTRSSRTSDYLCASAISLLITLNSIAAIRPAKEKRISAWEFANNATERHRRGTRI